MYQRTTPIRPSILQWVQNFKLCGTLEKRNASGRHLNSQQTIATVLNYFPAHTRRSVRRVELDLQLLRSTMHYILRRKIHIFPFKNRRVQQLWQRNWLKESKLLLGCSITSIPIWHSFGVPFFADECVFHISGIANNKYARFWVRVIRVWYKSMRDTAKSLESGAQYTRTAS